MNAIPMLGSLGSIVLVATMSGASTGGRQYIAAGMFLFATLGFVVVQIDRQRKQRIQQVTGTRTEYLRYLGNVRQLAREAADQQRRALTWHHPEPAALPAIAEDRTRVWEHGAADPQFLHVRYGVCHQPLSLELIPPESAPIDQVDPAAASALHRLLVVHRLQPDLPASIDLRAFDRVEICGPEEPARSLARAMICSATAFHSPEHLVVAVLTTEQNLAHWDWVKWLPHGQSAPAVRRGRARAGWSPPRSTSWPRCCPPTWSSGRGSAPTSGRPPRTSCSSSTAPSCRPATTSCPPDGVHGVTVLDLPTHWDELEDATRLRLQFESTEPVDGRYPVQALRLRDEVIRAKVDQCSLATAEAFARRLTPLHTVSGAGRAQQRRGRRRRRLHGAARRSATCTASTPTRPGSTGRPATGCGCRSAPATAARSCTSTSRSPPSRAWARTAW